MSCSCGVWPCGECGDLILMHEFVGNVCHDCAGPFVVVDLVDLVCEACDTEFEAARPDPDEPFVICGSCAVPA